MATGCDACDGVEGAVHTCPGSGTFLAAEAHDSGEIEAQAGAWPNWKASIELHLRAPSEATARQHLTNLIGALLDDALLSEIVFALEADDAGVTA